MSTTAAVLQFTSGVMSRRIQVPADCTRGKRFHLRLRTGLTFAPVRDLSIDPAAELGTILAFEWRGKTEGTDHVPVLELI